MASPLNVDTSIWPDNGVREVELAYKLDINEFRGNRSSDHHRQYLANLASVISIKKGGFGTIPLYHRILTSL